MFPRVRKLHSKHFDSSSSAHALSVLQLKHVSAAYTKCLLCAVRHFDSARTFVVSWPFYILTVTHH